MKNNKGITLIILAIYIVLVIFVVSILAVVVSNFRNNYDKLETETTIEVEFDKLNAQMLKETKNENNELQETKANKIVFFDGTNHSTYTYIEENKAIYLNDYIKIADNIEYCSFEEKETNGNKCLVVTVKINGEQRITEYVLSRHYIGEVNRPELIDGMIPVE